MATKKQTVILSKIKDFYYALAIDNVKHGFMTFNMENICVQKKFQNFLFYSRCVRKHVFLFLKFRQKPTSPAMRNNEFNSRGLNF